MHLLKKAMSHNVNPGTKQCFIKKTSRSVDEPFFKKNELVKVIFVANL